MVPGTHSFAFWRQYTHLLPIPVKKLPVVLAEPHEISLRFPASSRKAGIAPAHAHLPGPCIPIREQLKRAMTRPVNPRTNATA